MPNPPGNPLDPSRPIVVQSKSETVVRETVPVLQEDHSGKKAWIAGLAVLAFALLIGLLWSGNKEDKPERTDVTVNNTEMSTSKDAPDTTVIATDRVVTAPAEDVQVFVTTTEATMARLSRPDDAANQAELEAIRMRMEDLRQADQEQARAIRQELEQSIARLEAQAANAPAAQTTSTTVSTDGDDTTVTTETSNGDAASAAAQKAELDKLAKRIEDSTALLSQLEQTAAPQAAADVTKLNDNLATVRTKFSDAEAATGTAQSKLISEVDSELATLESAITSVPVQ